MSDPFDQLNAGSPDDSLAEARRQAASLDACIRALERSPGSADALDEVYRSAHSLKSEPASARTPQVQRLGQLIQEVVREIRAGRLEISSGLLSLLRSAAGASGAALEALATGSPAVEDPQPVAASLERLVKEARETPQMPAGAEQARELEKGTAAITLMPLDPRRLSVAVAASRSAAGAAAELSQAADAAAALLSELKSTIKRQEEALKGVLDALPNRLAGVAGGEPVTAVSKELSEKIGALAVMTAEREESLAGALARIGDAVRGCTRAIAAAGETLALVATVPVSSVLSRFARTVGDAAAKRGKRVSVSVKAGAAEMDASLAGALSAALRRCSRIAVESGIESPRQRKRKGKNSMARMKVLVREDDKGIAVALADDGRGLSEDSIASAQAAIGTALRKKGGSLEITSKPGKGTEFTLSVPRLRAGGTFTGNYLVARAAGSLYAVPESFVEECATIDPSEAVRSGGSERLKRGGEMLPIVRLGGAKEGRAVKGRAAAIVREGERSAALLFDSFIGTENLVSAPIAHRDARVPGMLGAGVRGDGSIAMILDVPALLQKTIFESKPPARGSKKRKR